MKTTSRIFYTCTLLAFLAGNYTTLLGQEKATTIVDKPKAPPIPPVAATWEEGTSGMYTYSNVGIGVASPLETLHLGGSIRGNQSGALRISSGNGWVDVGAKNSGFAHFYTDRPKYYFDKEIMVNSGYIGSYDEDLYLRAAGSTKMTILKNGNVGIGGNPGSATFRIYKADIPNFELASSVSRLEIGMATCGWCFASGARSGDAVLRTLGGTNSIIFSIPNDNNDGKSYIGFGDDANAIWLKIGNNRTVRMDGKLFVKEVEVNSNVWADFVFKKDYKLKPLAELENYIDENNHLPDLPSEKEVIEKGINLAKMDALLLQKIEELTLYVIEQGKQINALKQENQELKKATGLTK